MRAAVLILIVAPCLSGCAVYIAGSAVVSVASTVVTTTANVAGTAVCTIACDDDHEGKR